MCLINCSSPAKPQHEHKHRLTDVKHPEHLYSPAVGDQQAGHVCSLQKCINLQAILNVYKQALCPPVLHIHAQKHSLG